jgi:hypothetical protein
MKDKLFFKDLQDKKVSTLRYFRLLNGIIWGLKILIKFLKAKFKPKILDFKALNSHPSRKHLIKNMLLVLKWIIFLKKTINSENIYKEHIDVFLRLLTIKI